MQASGVVREGAMGNAELLGEPYLSCNGGGSGSKRRRGWRTRGAPVASPTPSNPSFSPFVCVYTIGESRGGVTPSGDRSGGCVCTRWVDKWVIKQARSRARERSRVVMAGEPRLWTTSSPHTSTAGPRSPQAWEDGGPRGCGRGANGCSVTPSQRRVQTDRQTGRETSSLPVHPLTRRLGGSWCAGSVRRDCREVERRNLTLSLPNPFQPIVSSAHTPSGDREGAGW